VIEREYVHTAAVAMASFAEVDDNIGKCFNMIKN
jgi:hypothetical protein